VTSLPTLLRLRIKKERRKNKIFLWTARVSLVFTLLVLLALVTDLFIRGADRISLDFLLSFPSRFADKAGIVSAWVGTLCVMIVTAFVSVPLGVCAGIYLEEYAKKNKITSIIEVAIANLAGVPSIIYGLMALGLFVYKFELGQSVQTAGLTLALLILPIIIVATREALRSIPLSVREAAAACGATKLQVIRHHLLPYSTGGILTGIIIALSRAIGETAPLVTIGALTYIAFLPHSPLSTEAPFVSAEWLKDPFTVLPIQVFNWVSRPQEEFHRNAAAAALILMVLTFSMNIFAIVLRARVRRKIKW